MARHRGERDRVRRRARRATVAVSRATPWTPSSTRGARSPGSVRQRLDRGLAAERDAEHADAGVVDLGAGGEVARSPPATSSSGVPADAERAAAALAVAVEVEEQDAVAVAGEQAGVVRRRRAGCCRSRGSRATAAPLRDGTYQPRSFDAAARWSSVTGPLRGAEVGVVDRAPDGQVGEVDGVADGDRDEHEERRRGGERRRPAERASGAAAQSQHERRASRSSATAAESHDERAQDPLEPRRRRPECSLDQLAAGDARRPRGPPRRRVAVRAVRVMPPRSQPRAAAAMEPAPQPGAERRTGNGRVLLR